ncbi:MAG: hypothetical protein JNM57_14725 [Cyclobacteriaceae bacterium]|nr:hypothetical protein [Cyclobacteriaceae bacterium]
MILLFVVAIRANCQNTNADSIQSTTSTQEHKDQRPLKEQISIGGSTGFWIQPKKTHLEVSVLLAYRFPKILTMGPGYRYIYTRNRVYGKDLNSYGPNAFARAQLTKRIYLWSEWEYLKTEYAVQLANNEITTKTDHVDSFFAGAGYIRKIGRKGRGGLSIQVLYNFLYNREDNTPYYSPLIYRVGYFF